METGETLTSDAIARFAARYDRILEVGRLEDAKQNPPIEQPAGKRGKPKQSKPKNLLNRLQEHRLAVLTFLCDPSVPFDNNQAERDVRMVKVQQKPSGTFRSEQGAKVFSVFAVTSPRPRSKHTPSSMLLIKRFVGGHSCFQRKIHNFVPVV